MRRSWITLGVMLAAVAGLGLWLSLRPPQVRSAHERVSNTTVDRVHAARVEWPGKASVELEQSGGTWRIVAPHAGRADGLQVDRILSLLQATAELVLPATDLARFELDTPRARITADGVTYAMGGVNPVTGGVYLLRGNQVLLLASRYAAVIPADPEALRDRRVLGAQETPAAFSFPQFTVVQQAGKWNVSPADGDLSQDDLLRWVEGWRLASALRTEAFDGPAPATHITVVLRDGRRIAIGVTELEGEIAFTRYDEHMRYYFFANSARHLLAPPGANLAAVPDK